MDLIVASVGTRVPAWVAAGWNEYARRFPPHLPVRLIEVPTAGKRAQHKAPTHESKALTARLPERVRRIALHGGARPWSTEALARNLADWQLDGEPVAFLIGGADGLDEQALSASQAHWSFGPAVFPHMLVRLMVIEQLYRAWTILDGHPYHRA
jgi:23S rRNA (pseudouridine1915-N3)-methyltransferase